MDMVETPLSTKGKGSLAETPVTVTSEVMRKVYPKVDSKSLGEKSNSLRERRSSNDDGG